MKKPVILVIDGQGGRIGRQLVEQLAARAERYEILAVGTNSIATTTMMKAGAARAGTGENAAVVNCRTADCIIGPLGILVADSMMGEITPAIAVAVGQSAAVKLLIPMNLCNCFIGGLGSCGIKEMIALTLEELDRRFAAREA
jgi:NAD(P)-dependent dehydrogenase (short-subunit alcohol dehydrogenase family)